MTRKALPLLLGLSALFLLFGCRGGGGPEPVVLVLLKTLDNPFFQDIQKGVEDTWSKQDAQILIRAGSKEGDVTSQRQVLNDIISRYVKGQKSPALKGLVLTPSGSGPELIMQIKTLRDAGVPVVLVDTRIDNDALSNAATDYSVFIGSSNEEGGALAAEEIANTIKTGGRLLLLNGVEGQETAEARRKGFLDKLQSLKNSGGVQFEVLQRTSNWRRDEARKTMAGLLALGHKFEAIFAANDEMALGATIAYAQAGTGQLPPIVGFDAIPEAREAVDKEKLLATVAQDPYGMGKSAAESLAKLLAGQSVVKEQIVSVKIVRKVRK